MHAVLQLVDSICFQFQVSYRVSIVKAIFFCFLAALPVCAGFLLAYWFPAHWIRLICSKCRPGRARYVIVTVRLKTEKYSCAPLLVLATNSSLFSFFVELIRIWFCTLSLPSPTRPMSLIACLSLVSPNPSPSFLYLFSSSLRRIHLSLHLYLHHSISTAYSFFPILAHQWSFQPFCMCIFTPQWHVWLHWHTDAHVIYMYMCICAYTTHHTFP